MKIPVKKVLEFRNMLKEYSIHQYQRKTNSLRKSDLNIHISTVLLQ